MRVVDLLVGLIFFGIAFCADVYAYESDQHTNRTQEVPDSLEIMDEQVNAAIEKVLNREHMSTSRKAVARGIWSEIGGIYWADKIERWAVKSPLIEKYDQTRHQNIYSNMPIWATRAAFIFGLGRTFKLNGVMVGSDKFGHFFSQGHKYYRRELRGEPEDLLLAKGAFAERWVFGQLTTGIFSNADLVANYEGWRFYQSLFDDGVTEGKPAILTLQDGKYVRRRQFTFADHVNAYWDEALNPAYNVRSINQRLQLSILELCPQARQAPAYYTTPDDDELWRRYQHIGLKDNRANQFKRLCDL